MAVSPDRENVSIFENYPQLSLGNAYTYLYNNQARWPLKTKSTEQPVIIFCQIVATSNLAHEEAMYTVASLKFILVYLHIKYEPPRGKTNNVVSEQVRHKPACTATEAG